MVSTYEVSVSEDKRYIQFHRTEEHPGTEGLFISDNPETGRSGATGVANDWDLPRATYSSQDFFEFRRGDDPDTYYRHMLNVMPELSQEPKQIVDPDPIPVRHRHWPGIDRAEIEAEEAKRADKLIRAALDRAARLRAYRARQAQYKAAEDELRKAVRLDYEQEHGLVTDRIREAMIDAGYTMEEIAASGY